MTIKVAIIESEAGWGRKIDEIREFETMEEAEDFVDDFNSYNTATKAPDWYMIAEILKN